MIFLYGIRIIFLTGDLLLSSVHWFCPIDLPFLCLTVCKFTADNMALNQWKLSNYTDLFTIV